MPENAAFTKIRRIIGPPVAESAGGPITTENEIRSRRIDRRDRDATRETDGQAVSDMKLN